MSTPKTPCCGKQQPQQPKPVLVDLKRPLQTESGSHLRVVVPDGVNHPRIKNGALVAIRGVHSDILYVIESDGTSDVAYGYATNTPITVRNAPLCGDSFINVYESDDGKNKGLTMEIFDTENAANLDNLFESRDAFVKLSVTRNPDGSWSATASVLPNNAPEDEA